MNEDKLQKLISRIQNDIDKAKVRLDAHQQENNIEQIGFEKGTINALTNTLFDINELNRSLDGTVCRNGKDIDKCNCC